MLYPILPIMDNMIDIDGFYFFKKNVLIYRKLFFRQTYVGSSKCDVWHGMAHPLVNMTLASVNVMFIHQTQAVTMSY